jgi:hypothetical protein
MIMLMNMTIKIIMIKIVNNLDLSPEERGLWSGEQKL